MFSFFELILGAFLIQIVVILILIAAPVLYITNWPSIKLQHQQANVPVRSRAELVVLRQDLQALVASGTPQHAKRFVDDARKATVDVLPAYVEPQAELGGADQTVLNTLGLFVSGGPKQDPNEILGWIRAMSLEQKLVAVTDYYAGDKLQSESFLPSLVDFMMDVGAGLLVVVLILSAIFL